MKETAYQMLYLTACALHGQVPDKEKIAHMDLTKLYQTCQFHSLTAITAMALESAGVSDPVWIEAMSKAVRKNILLDMEREKICSFLEDNGIWHMPLKGVILKEMYPKIGMRQMSDNDILYDKTYQKELRKFMLENGYKSDSLGKDHHDTYMKPPVFNFEMHTILYGRKADKAICDYYSDVKKRLVKDDGSNYRYHFTDEDFYIYMTVHEYKHFISAGTGLRSLLDAYVYISRKNDSLDWDYIYDELDKLGIRDYEKRSRSLSMKIFSSVHLPKLSDDEKESLEYYMLSGTYGTIDQFSQRKIDTVHEQIGTKSRASYIWHRIFPPMETYKMYFPFFYKHKILLPVGWSYRLIRGVTVRRKKLKSEIKCLQDSDDKMN
ncbi:MAG: nucleotidyltransferase family protein [Ruminococcus sp.]